MGMDDSIDFELPIDFDCAWKQSLDTACTWTRAAQLADTHH